MNAHARAQLEDLAAIAADPEGRAKLAALLAPLITATPRPEPVAYTVATLAHELGITEKSIRNAIGRGELAAVKRGARWIIRAGAAAAWASPPPARPRTTRGRPRPAASTGNVRAALSRAMGCDSVGAP